MLNTSQLYSMVAVPIHWAVALLIIVGFVLGLSVDDFTKSLTDAVINTHALAGLAAILKARQM